jgi:hypothetical protein
MREVPEPNRHIGFCKRDINASESEYGNQSLAAALGD